MAIDSTVNDSVNWLSLIEPSRKSVIESSNLLSSTSSNEFFADSRATTTFFKSFTKSSTCHSTRRCFRTSTSLLFFSVTLAVTVLATPRVGSKGTVGVSVVELFLCTVVAIFANESDVARCKLRLSPPSAKVDRERGGGARRVIPFSTSELRCAKSPVGPAVRDTIQ